MGEVGVQGVAGRTSGLASVGHGVGKVTEIGNKMNTVTLLLTSTTDHVLPPVKRGIITTKTGSIT